MKGSLGLLILAFNTGCSGDCIHALTLLRISVYVRVDQQFDNSLLICHGTDLPFLKQPTAVPNPPAAPGGGAPMSSVQFT
jgi:hypothetical protein